ncbi:MAG: hypothetical protein JWO97_850 [Acidobacteria bacterium]|nr:hypothetical protein [Acidobacteriota bacterium]
MRRFRISLAIALCVVSLAVSSEAAVQRDTGHRDTVIGKVLRQLKRVFLPGSRDDITQPKP